MTPGYTELIAGPPPTQQVILTWESNVNPLEGGRGLSSLAIEVSFNERNVPSASAGAYPTHGDTAKYLQARSVSDAEAGPRMAGHSVRLDVLEAEVRPLDVRAARSTDDGQCEGVGGGVRLC